MTDVVVEIRHRPTGDSDDEPAPGRHPGPSIAQERDRVIDMFEHL